MAKPVKTSKQSGYRTTRAQGIGYYIPDSMSNSEWHRIKQIWDHKLKQSSFVDIELFSHALDGHFLPLLTNNSIEKNQKLQKGAIGDGIAGYYDYCSTYFEHCDWRATFDKAKYGRQYALMRELFRLHKDGVSFRDMQVALKGKRSSYMKRFNIAPSHKRYRQTRSTFWCFDKTRSILSEMWLWHATNELGSLTPYDLKHMQATGITPEVIAAAETIVRQKEFEASDVYKALQRATAQLERSMYGADAAPEATIGPLVPETIEAAAAPEAPLKSKV